MKKNTIRKTDSGTQKKVQEQAVDTQKNENSRILPPEKQRELLIMAKNGDLKARELLISKNMPIVVRIAKYYSRFGLSFHEIISEGSLGLNKAIDSFDIQKTNSYIAYAAWWIRYYIVRFIRNSSPIPKPENQIRELALMEKIKTRMKHNPDYRNLDQEEQEAIIAQEMNIPHTRLKKVLSNNFDVLSLEHCVFQDGNVAIQLKDVVADMKIQSPEQCLIQEETHRLAQYCINKLPKRDAEIITMRYGIKNGKHCSLEYLSNKLNISIERIRQLERQIIRKVRLMMIQFSKCILHQRTTSQ